MIFSLSIVLLAVQISALETCLQTTSGKICQEYNTTAACSAACSSSCISSPISQVSQCMLGTCYDEQHGVCSVNTYKFLCEQQQGIWYANATAQQCTPGCCVLADRTSFMPRGACSVTSQQQGAVLDWRPDLNVSACAAVPRTQEEGACVLTQGNQNTCKFTTKAQCTQLAGKFASGYLCSSPDLKTTCQKQASTGCVEGRDEIYWFDSCGNRENIYSANRADSFNSGRVLAKAESCSLASGTNLLANQKTCGNCNYQLGTQCASKTATQRLSDSIQGVVCLNKGCVDELGVSHQQGESWCAHQSAIGVQNGRGVDTPGSRYYRKVCFDGVIRTEPCADYRNELCVQASVNLTLGRSITSAACRPNLAASCYEFNQKNRPANWKEECQKNTDCFIKELKISKKFAFDVCVPKYKPGFDLGQTNDDQQAKDICGIASQKCTYVKVSDTFGGDQEFNKECLTPKFAEEMNNLCMSLGDCGAQANYLGEVTQSYELKRNGKRTTAGKLTALYLDGLKQLADESRYKNQKPADPGIFYSLILTRSSNDGRIIVQGSFGRAENALNLVPIVGPLLYTTVANPGKITLDPITSFTLNLFGFGGDTKKIRVQFTCQPWQAPNGGAACTKCGTDSFPCSKYACQSLGKTCSFINEEEKGVGECVDINPGDVTPPTITPDVALLPQGFSAQVGDFSVAIKSSEADGCIKETNTQIPFGIKVSEHARCRFDYNTTQSFDEMGFDVNEEGSLQRNFSLPLSIPSLESLGIKNPHARYDFNMYLRCEDASGNVPDYEYVVNFCIKQGVDTTPPTIVARDPTLESVAYGSSSINASVFVNEPAECRYDITDKPYSLLRYPMECITDFDERDVTRHAWPCTASFPLNSNENNFFVRCLDQPWLNATTPTARMASTPGYRLGFKAVTTPLSITNVVPNATTLIVGQEPASLQLKFNTQGGYDGTARCTYRLGNSSMISFYEGEGTTTHIQTFNALLSGAYEIPISCVDSIGNRAQATASFSISIDSQPPRMSRVYRQGESLVLITDEPATCYASASTYDACTFAFENATEMIGLDFVHTTPFNGDTLYIKCKDIFGKVPGTCTTIVKEGDLKYS